jgi:hypothetical protein
MEIGAEMPIYLTHVAFAVNHKERVVDITHSDIYRKASCKFRVAGSEISLATY